MVVAPFAGAWIEIFLIVTTAPDVSVAPFAGAWIEIHIAYNQLTHLHRRSLRGSVD